MKKVIVIIMTLMSVLMCSIEKSEKKGIEGEKGILQKVVIGLDDTFAPMGFKNEKGEIVGFDIDLAKAAAKKLNIEVEFKSINWDSKIMELNGGNIDLIWNGLTITSERIKEMEMSEPYLENSQIIIVKKNSSINKKSDLKGKIVASQTQSSGEEAVLKSQENKEFKDFKTYAQYDQAFMDLDLGRIDAIVADEILAKYIKSTKEKQLGREIYLILDENYGNEEYGIAAKKGNIELINALNKVIQEMKNEGIYKEIYSKWFKD